MPSAVDFVASLAPSKLELAVDGRSLIVCGTAVIKTEDPTDRRNMKVRKNLSAGPKSIRTGTSAARQGGDLEYIPLAFCTYVYSDSRNLVSQAVQCNASMRTGRG